MTIFYAISSEIEPYEISDNAIEKTWLDACDRYGVTADVQDTYGSEQRKAVAYASLLGLNRLRSLTAENAGGISQNYDLRGLIARMKTIAQSNGIDISTMIAEADNEVKAVHVW